MNRSIGITGAKGFIGKHLVNYLHLQNNVSVIPIDNKDYNDDKKLKAFVKQCEIIVHLAAVNRHDDPQYIYEANVSLVSRLIEACKIEKVSPHILISSSTQEDGDNLYGKSKREGRLLLEKWASECGGMTTGMIIPNVFGPFGKPFYNSVVATFCHQLATGDMPEIHNDGMLNLVYINDLIEDIYKLINNRSNGLVKIEARYSIKVSELKHLLTTYRDEYLVKGEFPDLSNSFELALFNTYRTYIPHDHYPVNLVKHSDERGAFVEVTRAGSKGQFSYSTTVPGIVRGNHFHTRKAERFAVISGKAKISLRKIDSDEVIDYFIDGTTPGHVDMPIWHTHNITNIGEEVLVTLFWINEPYDPEDPDTFFIDVDIEDK